MDSACAQNQMAMRKMVNCPGGFDLPQGGPVESSWRHLARCTILWQQSGRTVRHPSPIPSPSTRSSSEQHNNFGQFPQIRTCPECFPMRQAAALPCRQWRGDVPLRKVPQPGLFVWGKVASADHPDSDPDAAAVDDCGCGGRSSVVAPTAGAESGRSWTGRSQARIISALACLKRAQSGVRRRKRHK